MWLILLATTAMADDWYVNAAVPTSGDGTTRWQAFKTLDEALDASWIGDTVYVAAGEYESARVWTPRLRIVGEGSATQIDALSVSALDVQIEDLELVGENFGLSVLAGSVTTRGVDFTDAGGEIGAYVVDGELFIDEALFDGPEYGVYAVGGSIKVTDSSFLDVDYGYVDPYGASVDLLFRRNKVVAGRTGMVIEALGSKTVHRNLFDGWTGIDAFTGTPMISGNVFLSDTGIRIENSESTIVHNTFVGATSGIKCGEAGWADDSVVANNAFYKGTYGFTAGGRCDAVLTANAFSGLADDVVGSYIDGGSNKLGGTWALQSNYTPKGGLSPLVGSAVSAGGPARDFYGKLRDIHPDIGAVEYASMSR